MVLYVDFVDTEIPNDLPVSLVQRHKGEGSIPEAQPGNRQLLGTGWYGSYGWYQNMRNNEHSWRMTICKILGLSVSICI
jgi:hypothetical protein